MVVQPPPQPKRAAQLENEEGAEKAAESRLLANSKKKEFWGEITSLKKDCNLSDEVELALKLLEPAKLRKLFASHGGTGELRRRLVGSSERDNMVRAMVAKFAPDINELVTKLEWKQAMQK